jgi:uncharacterized protein (TIGR02271 family)
VVERSKSSAGRDAGGDQVVVPVRREQLRVDKKRVDTGQGVRVHTSVVEHPCRIEEALLRDEVVVTHVPADKIIPLSEAPEPRYEGDTLIIPVLEEVLVVEKRLRLKEEIRIDRKQRTEQYVETVPLKSEEISIERFDEQREAPKA